MRKRVLAGAIAVAVVTGGAAGWALSGGSPGTSQGPSVAACTKAYPAWYEASFVAGHTTATPPECQGLSDAQVLAIAEGYQAAHGGGG